MKMDKEHKMMQKIDEELMMMSEDELDKYMADNDKILAAFDLEDIRQEKNATINKNLPSFKTMEKRFNIYFA